LVIGHWVIGHWVIGHWVIGSLVIGSLVIGHFRDSGWMFTTTSARFRPQADCNSSLVIRSIFTENKVVVKTCVNWQAEVVSTEFQKDESTI